jgi:hypothetical protein
MYIKVDIQVLCGRLKNNCKTIIFFLVTTRRLFLTNLINCNNVSEFTPSSGYIYTLHYQVTLIVKQFTTVKVVYRTLNHNHRHIAIYIYRLFIMTD